jgi:hypothetical protein
MQTAGILQSPLEILLENSRKLDKIFLKQRKVVCPSNTWNTKTIEGNLPSTWEGEGGLGEADPFKTLQKQTAALILYDSLARDRI